MKETGDSRLQGERGRVVKRERAECLALFFFSFFFFILPLLSLSLFFLSLSLLSLSFSLFRLPREKTKKLHLHQMNLEAQARYAARAAELKALGGLAPARASALSRLALKTVVKVRWGRLVDVFEEKQQLSRLSVASRALFRTSDCFGRAGEAPSTLRVLSNATAKASSLADS